jgi:hypothetical protein
MSDNVETDRGVAKSDLAGSVAVSFFKTAATVGPVTGQFLNLMVAISNQSDARPAENLRQSSEMIDE